MRKDIMTKKLIEAFSPQFLEVVDESSHHAGHSGARPGGETHYRILIVASAFAGKTRVAIHRLINEALAQDLQSGVHALAIEAKAA